MSWRISTEFDWMRDAACRDVPSEVFFDDGVYHITVQPRWEAAKAVCSRCPVRRSCLEYAITTPERFGVWGGLDPEEREKVRRWLRYHPETVSIWDVAVGMKR